MKQKQLVRSVFLAFCVALVAVLFVASSQDWDVRHTAHMGSGLLRHGFLYYTQNEAFTYANYLPSTYILTQLALLPATLVKTIWGGEHCSLLNKIPCMWDVYALKLVTVLLAFVWVGLVVKKKRATGLVAVLATPTVLYAWLVFGAYDAVGAFAALIGGTFFFGGNGSDNGADDGALRGRYFVAGAGLLLAAMGVGAKFLPLPLFVGCALAYSKSMRRFWFGMAFVLAFTALQVFVANAYGCRWHDLVHVGKGGSSWVSTVAKLAPLLPVLVVCGGLFVVYVRKGPSLALGALAALSSYALLFPVMWPHPQWYFYYGLALVAAAATIPLQKNRRRFLLAVGVVQGVSVASAAQWLPNNADITMTGRALALEISALGDVYPLAAEFLQRWGRKLLATTLVLSWAVLALEWWQIRRNERTEAAVLEKKACDVNFVARLCVWSGVAFLVTWLALLVAVVV